MDPWMRTEEDRELVDWAGQLATQLATRSDTYDREGTFVHEQIDLLTQAGYASLTVPKEYGGRGCNLRQLLLAQERLAEGDSAAALVMGWHLGITQSLAATKAWPDDMYRAFCADVVAGRALVNACGTEPDTGSPSRGGRPTTVAKRTAGGYSITGLKTWATGSPVITHILVTATISGEDSVGEFLVPRASAGLSVQESWDSMSMRGTGSHTLALENVFVPDAHLLDTMAAGRKPKRSSDGSGWLLHIPATYLGIANAARRFILDFANAYAPNSLGKPIATAPHVREKIGQMEVERTTARTLLYATATQYDETAFADRLKMRADLGLAKHVTTNAAVRIVDLSMRIAGGQSLLRSLPLERYYRDVRAGLHNPPMDDVILSVLADSALQGQR